MAGELTPQPHSLLDITSLLVLLWQKKLRILLLAALMTIVGGYYVAQLPKVYVASSTLLLGSNGSRLSLPGNLASIAGNEDSQLDTYIEFIRSRQFALSVAEQLQLRHMHEFQPAQPQLQSASPDEYAADILLRRMTLRKLSNTNMLKVSVESKQAETAERIANHIGPEFFRFYANMRR